MRYVRSFHATALAAALLSAIAAAPAFAQSAQPVAPQAQTAPQQQAQLPPSYSTSGAALLHQTPFPGAVTDSTGVTHYGVYTATEAYRLGAL